MNNEPSRLVLRRTAGEKGNMFAVRLAEQVDRTADLYGLFRQGFVVEVIDVEFTEEQANPTITLGVRAPEAFRVDRVERITKPRTAIEIGEEVSVRYPVLTRSEVEALSLDEIDALLADARDAQQMLKAQLTRLKRDKSKAHNRGYQHANNNVHHVWLMLVEETDVVAEQLEFVKNSCNQLREAQKHKWHGINIAKRKAFESHFIRLARETLSEESFEELRNRAQVLADQPES